jgi:hypothetical protein
MHSEVEFERFAGTLLARPKDRCTLLGHPGARIFSICLARSAIRVMPLKNCALSWLKKLNLPKGRYVWPERLKNRNQLGRPAK